MYARVVTIGIAVATFTFAAAMLWLESSASALIGNLRHFLGPLLLAVFLGLIVWGMNAAAWAYAKERARVEMGLAHLSMVQDVAMNVGVLGALAGILIMVTNLASAAEHGVSAFNTAVPGVLSGLVLKLSSAMAGYALALKFRMVSKHAELRASIEGFVLSTNDRADQSNAPESSPEEAAAPKPEARSGTIASAINQKLNSLKFGSEQPKPLQREA